MLRPNDAAYSHCIMHHSVSTLTHRENKHFSPFFPTYKSLNLFPRYFGLGRSVPLQPTPSPRGSFAEPRPCPLCLNLSTSSCLSPTLKRESLGSFETTVNFYKAYMASCSRRGNFFSQHRGKLKLHKLGTSDVTLLVRSLSFDELPRRVIEKI